MRARVCVCVCVKAPAYDTVVVAEILTYANDLVSNGAAVRMKLTDPFTVAGR